MKLKNLVWLSCLREKRPGRINKKMHGRFSSSDILFISGDKFLSSQLVLILDNILFNKVVI